MAHTATPNDVISLCEALNMEIMVNHASTDLLADKGIINVGRTLGEDWGEPARDTQRNL